jgi:hypothetical protein
MATPRTTKTLGPLHFEDLEPHRFEDLIRELAYDYKDWQTIEATGRSGSDEGWDIRAFEKSPRPETEDDEAEAEDAPHPMEGNAWMIQVKREKSLGPSDVKQIVSDVNAENPPYGYILAAPSNFSKKSYDAFRTELRAKGVREFYVWGRAELEDLLHMPMHDRILFTFFGISLSSRRRTRATEVRAAIAVKNKLYRAVGEGQNLYKTILLRDLSDTHYPFASKYPDFAERRRWRQLTAEGHHPLGLVVRVNRFYAYIDRARKEWDFTTAIDLCDDEHNLRQSDDEREAFQRQQEKVMEAWEFLPQACQGTYTVNALVPYARIAAIDEKGDVLYECPHLFVDFGAHGPYEGQWEFWHIGSDDVRLTREFKRIKIFPKTFTVEPARTPTMTLSLNQETLQEFADYKDVGVLYSKDDRYKTLRAKDVVAISAGAPTGKQRLLQITHIGSAKVGEYLKDASERFKFQRAIQLQLGGEVTDDDEITYLEYKRYYKRPESEETPLVIAPEE